MTPLCRNCYWREGCAPCATWFLERTPESCGYYRPAETPVKNEVKTDNADT